MFDEKVVESAQKDEALSLGPVSDVDIDLYFASNMTIVEQFEEKNAKVSIRCAYLSVNLQDIYLVFVANLGGHGVLKSIWINSLVNFMLTCPTHERKMIEARDGLVEHLVGVLAEGIAQAA